MRLKTILILGFCMILSSCEEKDSPISKISSGTSFGECIGYCQRELIIQEGQVSYVASGYDILNFPELQTDTAFSAQAWEDLVALVDFDELLGYEDVIGCPDCADGGAEWIEVVLDGQSKKITFEYGDSLASIQDLVDELRAQRDQFETGLFHE